MPYNEGNVVDVPSSDLLTVLFESAHCAAVEDTPLHAEASDPSSSIITKAQARKLTKQIAYFLRHRYGIGASGPNTDVVVAFSTGQSALPCVFFGVVAADGVYSAASPSLEAAQLAGQIRDGPARVLICSDDVKETAVAAAEMTGLSKRDVLVLRSSPSVQLESVDESLQCSFDSELEWRKITSPAELKESRIGVLYSSGTTGSPKGILISHANMVAEAFLPASINRPIWAQWAADGKAFVSRTLAHLPTAHVSAVQGYFVNPFFDGGIVYWMPSFDFAKFLEYNAKLQITTFFSAPPIYTAIAKHPAVSNQFASLRIAYSGGSPLSREVETAARVKLGGGSTLLSQTWGASETTGAVTHMPPDRTDLTGSVGGLLPNMLLRIVDEHEKDVAPGHSGEALLQGPVITQGYHNNSQATAAAFTSDGWFRTGDIVRIENGLCYVSDRKMDLIKHQEKPISPTEIETILLSHPSIRDAAVIGAPTDDGTEAPRAFVVQAPGTSVSEQEVADYVRERVPAHMQLRGGVVFVAAIPRSPAGKVLRRNLRELTNASEEQ